MNLALKARFVLANLFVLIFIFASSSCKKEESHASNCSGSGSSESPGALNDNIMHWKFAQGSYWIYRNDSSGVEDSVYIQNIVFGTEEDVTNAGPGSGDCHGVGETYELFIGSASSELSFQTKLFRSRYSITLVNSSHPEMQMVLNESHTYQSNFSSGGQTFQSVYEVDYWPEDYAVAEGLGIVKYVNRHPSNDFDPDSWTLVRWNVLY